MSDVVYEAETAIVGAGAAGCVLAARLTEDPAHRVVLIEAGPDYPSIDLLPEELRDGRRSAGSHDWAFTDELTAAWWPGHALVGGCSATNGTVALRGTVRDFDGWAPWATPAGPTPSAADFLKVENDLDFADRWHGNDGRCRSAASVPRN